MNAELSSSELRGLNKAGNVLLPGNATFVSFSKSGCAKNIGRILPYMPDPDRKDLLMLLSIFSWFPKPILALLFRFLEIAPLLPRFIPGGALMRFIRLGLRGLLMSLYYGDEGVLEKLDYHVGVSQKD